MPGVHLLRMVMEDGTMLGRCRNQVRIHCALLILGLVCSGCRSFSECSTPPAECPRELTKINLPDYVIEPPDVLVLDAMRLVPKPPYKIQPGDAIFVQATGTPAEEPIKGAYRIEPDGMVRLGPSYGSVKVDEMTVDEATKAIEQHLKKTLANTTVFVALEESARVQQIGGEHMVRPDGTVSLGIYGRVNVTGKNQDDARKVIEDQLAKFFVNPKVSVSVAGFNSKVYYIIFDGGGSGEQIYRYPVTGNETVLDAIAQAQGLPPVSSTRRIWISRPAPANSDCDQILPIDWAGVTMRARTATNYQVLPGDRIYVQADPLIRLDTMLAKFISPIERVLGVTLLGRSTVRQLAIGNDNNGSGFGGSGF